jgi:hypothetical protein
MAFRQSTPTGPKVNFYGRNLKLLNPALFANVSKQSGDPLEGYVTLRTNSLDPDIREQLMESLVLMGKMPAPGSMEEHEAMNRALIDEGARKGEAENKAKAIQAAVVARLDTYQREEGLQPSDANVAAITAYIQNYLRGQWRVETVNEAVRYLTRHGKLTYQKTPVVTAPAEPTEVLVTLSDGSKQLPLDKPVPRSATVAQAKDYLARAREKNPYHRTGSSFGAKF